jgi:thiamine-phosphate pyrophosphorylase
VTVLAQDIDLLVITDRNKTRGRQLSEVIGLACNGGARWFQLREKDMPVGKLLALAAEIRAITAERGARLIINDRADVALAVGADGVHLPANGFPPEVARRLVGEGVLVGVSTHSEAEARRAAEGGADYLTFGPLFYTPSKAAYGPPVGLDALSQLAGRLEPDVPILGLGGVRPGNVSEVISSGAKGVALISAVISADDPARAAREILDEIAEAAPQGMAAKGSAQVENRRDKEIG